MKILLFKASEYVCFENLCRSAQCLYGFDQQATNKFEKHRYSLAFIMYKVKKHELHQNRAITKIALF